MRKPIEACTYDELKDRLRTRLVDDLFAGTLNDFIGAAVELSIRWYNAEQHRKNIEAKSRVPNLVEDSDLSVRAINALTGQGWTTAKDVHKNIGEQMVEEPYVSLVKLVCRIPNVGRRTAREIIEYYGLGRTH